ncbi:sialate O-acetylesterase [Brevundimonas sp. VNH65]|uniref:sialate O-acetylesterase n=1 Tax=Brevundimonas sp. VNH65 TaxID=3400917 RepID=UPI003BFC1E4B
MSSITFRRLLLAFGLASVAAPVSAAPLTLEPLFSDHMVVQRGRPVTVRGQGAPGARITVRLLSAEAQSVVGVDGRWSASLPAVDGGVGDLTVTEAGGATLTVADVAAGDVFLCSGQSNMDLAVSDAAYPRRTAEEGEGVAVRLLKVRRTSRAVAADRLDPELAWARAGASSLPTFSAACWHMGRTLAAEGDGTPIGLIQASWGGTSIEDWIMPDALRTLTQQTGNVRRLAGYGRDPVAATTALAAETQAWADDVDARAVAEGVWTEAFDDSAWPEMRLPGSWERSGVEDLAAFDGLMWFRRDVALTPEQAARGATLSLGRIDERDQVWINGVLVGSSLMATEIRRYAVPAGLLKPGRNVVAIRVIDERGAGGLMSRRPDLGLQFDGAADINLAGDWRYQAGPARRTWSEPPPFVPWAAPRGVSTLWNGMIAPLQGFPVKGVAWYQGETNTAEAGAYAELLTLWASSWRAFFGDPDLPLVVAQLPGYGPRSAVPSDGDWPRLREVQRLVAKADDRMGLAVLIDQGVAHDIHPAHKEKVGERLAFEMLRLAYGQSVPRAPSPVEARRTVDGIRIAFEPTDSALTVFGSHDAAAFELCDAARRCRFVPARVEGTAILLPSDAAAREVRYAWQGSPPINLYGDGLPAMPFALQIREDRDVTIGVGDH